jgi:hypothetical protein
MTGLTQDIPVTFSKRAKLYVGPNDHGSTEKGPNHNIPCWSEFFQA